MPAQFTGDLDDLKSAVDKTGFKGEWRACGNGQHQFRAREGAQLNWWESSGTINFSGKQDRRERLREAVERVLAEDHGHEAMPSAASSQRKRQIFVVHGHDTAARDQLELALRRLELEPFILMNTSGGGKTIIEALEGQIGRDFSSDFGIVLMTPDDVGYAKIEGEEKAEPRPRQNVILETGMLLSSLTRDRMALLVKGHLELPSDLQGIIRLGFNEHIREIVPKLCTRLKEAGIYIDAGKIAEASA
jgi:predicted nucleotide-binding protein